MANERGEIMAAKVAKEKREEAIRLIGEAGELRSHYWGKLREIETALGEDVDDLEYILDSFGHSVDEDGFDVFLHACDLLDAKEAAELEEGVENES